MKFLNMKKLIILKMSKEILRKYLEINEGGII